MTNNEKTLLNLAGQISGAYVDFNRSIVALAKHYDVTTEMISFIQNSSNLNTDDVLDYFDSITPRQEIIITD